MGLSRRELLGAAAVVPVGLAAGAVIASAGRAVGAAVAAARPSASGSSATRCARCGEASHAMLDPVCPMSPRVLSDAG